MTPNLDAPSLSTALLRDLMGDAARLAEQAHSLLAPVAQTKDDLRATLLDHGYIVPIADPTTTTRTLAAVDGGSVREHLYAADLMVAVAASASGLTSKGTAELRQAHWTRLLTHTAENDRLLSAAMASLEVRLLHELAHDIRILDGSHATPIIALAKALHARSAQVVDETVALCTEDVMDALIALANVERRDGATEIIALPKADSAHHFADNYRHMFGHDLPGGDRFIAAQILNPGEMLMPRAAREIVSTRITTGDAGDARAQAVAARLDDAISPLRDAARDRRLLVTYVKPETADVPIKMEFHVSDPLREAPRADDPAVTEARRLGRIISDETPGPHMQEPFAQHAVDLIAKNVAVGSEALNAGMLAHLPDGSDGYRTLLARSYRTGKAPR